MKTLSLHVIAALAGCLLLSACASKMETGYGVGAQAEREAALQRASQRDSAPDTPGMYLALIDRMQTQGLYFASLAHIDAYEKQYGASPDTTLLRADALRQTAQPEASAAAYLSLAGTPLEARGHRGLGLLAGQAADFPEAAAQFQTASRLEPTDALTLSDLGYAHLRMGDVASARVPLMKAAELAQNNPKILSNVALYLYADGRDREAERLIAQQNFPAAVQQAIQVDAKRIAAAAQRFHHAESAERAAATVPTVAPTAAPAAAPAAPVRALQPVAALTAVAPRVATR